MRAVRERPSALDQALEQALYILTCRGLGLAFPPLTANQSILRPRYVIHDWMDGWMDGRLGGWEVVHTLV